MEIGTNQGWTLNPVGWMKRVAREVRCQGFTLTPLPPQSYRRLFV